MATALSRAKTLLYMNQNETMTGYTPQGKEYFVDAGAFTHSPKRGDVIYFYSTAKGRIGHVGIVSSVDENEKIVYTVEGNTSGQGYAENGGCVARHSYSYANQGGTNRVNGFGRPNFKAAGVTADQFVKTAESYIGYLEKESNSQLDSFTANAGSNNYQKFQRDIGAGNGDQWCQFFVSAIALYTCQGMSGSNDSDPAKKMKKTKQWSGYVTASTLNVRSGPGTGYETLAFSPLPNGTKVDVCDESDGWYYIAYNGQYGFVSGEYLSKEKPETKSTKTAKDISAGKILIKAKEVMDKAREEAWEYGDSHSTPPCKDGKISCDRLIARTLYELGFKDQRAGGETCGTLDEYLMAHGFERSTSPKSIRKGSILLVKHKGQSYVGHAFIALSYDANTWVTARYDAGSDKRIQSNQPIRNVEWEYRKDDLIVYNIPSEEFNSIGEAKSTYEGLLKMRETPTLTGNIILYISKGGRMELSDAVSGIWTKVRCGGKIGWVKTRFIEKN